AKLDTITKLVAGRQAPPKVLLAVSSGIPKEVWIGEIGIKDETMKVKGSSLGFAEISDFMKSLNESAFFTDLRLVDTKKGKDDQGYEVADFEISAKRRTQ